MFMYLWKNWDLIGILSFEIGFLGLDLGFGLGFAPWNLRFENKRFEIFM